MLVLVLVITVVEMLVVAGTDVLDVSTVVSPVLSVEVLTTILVLAGMVTLTLEVLVITIV